MAPGVLIWALPAETGTGDAPEHRERARFPLIPDGAGHRTPANPLSKRRRFVSLDATTELIEGQPFRDCGFAPLRRVAAPGEAAPDPPRRAPTALVAPPDAPTRPISGHSFRVTPLTTCADPLSPVREQSIRSGQEIAKCDQHQISQRVAQPWRTDHNQYLLKPNR